MIDTTSPHGKLILAVLAALAEFERSMILARTGEGRTSKGCEVWKEAEANGASNSRGVGTNRSQERHWRIQPESQHNLTVVKVINRYATAAISWILALAFVRTPEVAAP